MAPNDEKYETMLLIPLLSAQKFIYIFTFHHQSTANLTSILIRIPGVNITYE